MEKLPISLFKERNNNETPTYPLFSKLPHSSPEIGQIYFLNQQNLRKEDLN
ncbi:uncharacterized protein METZ01_LOCUS92845 [marine metagenome]|jgi:hypothetical protein|uniref:Uncharacterized protein n=1 Tax=marine metagenome TaxID=408172 RepID=A0A381VIZ4_9ZZZZ